MLKLLIAITFFGTALIALMPQKQKQPFSAFEYKYESKNKLLSLGFVQDSFKTFDNHRIANDNKYRKIVNDTLIEFLFSNTILVSKKIVLNIKLTDTAVLLAKLNRKGFKSLPPSVSSASFDLVNHIIKEHFFVYINSRYIIFHNQYIEIKENFPEADSISVLRNE